VFKNEVCQRKDQLQDIKHIQELRTFLSKLLSRWSNLSRNQSKNTLDLNLIIQL